MNLLHLNKFSINLPMINVENNLNKKVFFEIKLQGGNMKLHKL